MRYTFSVSHVIERETRETSAGFFQRVSSRCLADACKPVPILSPLPSFLTDKNPQKSRRTRVEAQLIVAGTAKFSAASKTERIDDDDGRLVVTAPLAWFRC